MSIKGRIKKINPQTFTGEIRVEGSGEIVFFEKKSLQGDPKRFKEGALVEFDREIRSYRAYATKVILVGSSVAGESRVVTSKPEIRTNPKSSFKDSRPRELQREQSTHQRQTNRRSPYGFHRRRLYSDGSYKESLSRTSHISHERLHEARFDIAFEIEWQNLTPVAVNPCTDMDIPPSPIDPMGSEFLGYNKRWLMIDGRLAISPFTVKSAIANGFANIMGACYRVVTAIVGHPPKIEEGHYYYTGKYRRYRVAMDGSSKPGIIVGIETNEDGSRNVRIQPVKEFYYDEATLPSFIKNNGDVAYISDMKPRGYKPPIIVALSQKGPEDRKVIYYGPYRDGMNAESNHNKHKHRFYRPDGHVVSGTIKAENFFPPEELKRIVYMGDYKKEGTGKIWYEDLNTLKVGDFVYYETFGGRVTNIGKNFLFKALFSIEDAIPEGYTHCESPDELCPRCSMFGMTGAGTGEEHGGYKGRFKSCTLIGKTLLKLEEEMIKIPLDAQGNSQQVKVVKLVDGKGNTIGRQYLLPIQGQPKPNKRDVDGYFNKTTGQIKGAKYYNHTECNIDALIRETDKMTKMPESDLEYTHKLRNFAHVLTAKETFSGVVGAENCSVEEISALILLLESKLIGYAYKIGMGKSLGLGTMISKIKRVWIRPCSSDYTWKSYDSYDSFLASQQTVSQALERLKRSVQIANTIQFIQDDPKLPTVKLTYPPPKNYWKNLW